VVRVLGSVNIYEIRPALEIGSRGASKPFIEYEKPPKTNVFGGFVSDRGDRT
jgi:hypothetical protein